MRLSRRAAKQGASEKSKRPWLEWFPPFPLERVAQGELDQPRHTLGADDEAEFVWALHISGNRGCEVGVVPAVKEISRDPQ
jgi:hypothetical protein